MRDYGKVHSSFWTSPTTGSMSDDAKLLAIYLLTCQHSTIAGVFRLPDGYVAEDLGWVPERVSKGFVELFDKGFANRCETTKWVWIRQHLKWNRPENPNQRKSVAKIALSVPNECAWKPDFMRVFSPLIGFEDSDNENPSETVPEPFRNQEQKQKQDSVEPQGLRPVARGPAFAELPVADGSDEPIAVAECDEWASAYPAVDVRAEIRRMRIWLNANPTKRKTRRGLRRFVVAWLAKQQDSPRKGGAAEAPAWAGAK